MSALRRLIVLSLAALLYPTAVLAQENGWKELKNGWGELKTATGGSTTPATCTTAGQIPLFLGSPLALGCDAGLTYDAAVDTLTVGTVALAASTAELGYSAAPASYGMHLFSGGVIGWSSTLGWDGANDLGLARASAGWGKTTDGSTGYGGWIVKGLQYVTGSRPTCDASARGMTWYVAGGAGVADTIEICGKAAADTYSWVALATF